MELLNRATQSMVYGTDMQSTKISNDLLKTSEPLDYDLSPIIDWNKKLDELQFPTSVEKSANEGDLSCKTNLSDKKDQAESAAEQGNIDQLAQTTIFEEQVPNMESIAAIQTYEATSTPMKNKRQGKLGANRKTLKGEVRHLPNGTLEWRSQYEWSKFTAPLYIISTDLLAEPAVHHYEIRQDLIAEMNAQGTYGTYAQEWKCL